ncbi:MAG: hypothetical protein ACR65U_01800 [Methylocystis sp.]
MSIELRVTGDDAETIAKDIAILAGELGLVAGAVRFELFEEHTIVGTALAVR